MKTYIIPKGWHYSLHLPKLYDGNKKEFLIKVQPDDSWRYNFNSADQLDLNKVWGIGFGNILLGDHHKNSIRLSWWYNPRLDIIGWFYYYYENSVRKYGFIRSSKINELVEFPFILNDDSFEIGDEVVPYIYPEDRSGYELFPYFGGNRTAPHIIKHKLNIE